MSEEKPKTVKVRTTMQPWQEIEVEEYEAEDLRRQGLLVEKDSKKAEGSK